MTLVQPRADNSADDYPGWRLSEQPLLAPF